MSSQEGATIRILMELELSFKRKHVCFGRGWWLEWVVDVDRHIQVAVQKQVAWKTGTSKACLRLDRVEMKGSQNESCGATSQPHHRSAPEQSSFHAGNVRFDLGDPAHGRSAHGLETKMRRNDRCRGSRKDPGGWNRYRRVEQLFLMLQGIPLPERRPSRAKP